MGIATFNGDVISGDSYIVPQGNSTPKITTFPRTIGGIIQESGVVEKTLDLKSFLIVPKNTTRLQIEAFFNSLNERIGTPKATLNLNGNDYPNATVKGITYNHDITNSYVRYSIPFLLGEQNDGSSVRQLSCPELQNFSRGRKMTFLTKLDDGTSRTFTFINNFDNVRNLEISLNVKHSSQFGGYSSIVKQGGFERIVCEGWIIGPTSNNRKNIEAYFYNILNGPLGRVGTLTVDGQQKTYKCILTDLNVNDTVEPTVKYTLTFLASLQC